MTEDKLDIDRLALGSLREHFAYIQTRLGGTAAHTVRAYVQTAKANNTCFPDAFLAYMENIYGDANLAE